MHCHQVDGCAIFAAIRRGSERIQFELKLFTTTRSRARQSFSFSEVKSNLVSLLIEHAARESHACVSALLLHIFAQILI